jgi:hypothetical protein
LPSKRLCGNRPVRLQFQGKVAVTCLLILSIAIPLSTSNAQGQSVSTSTSIVSSAQTYFVSTTTTKTFTISDAFDLAPPTLLHCSQRALPFVMAKGLQISGTVWTNATVEFMVMSNDRYSVWSEKACIAPQAYSLYIGTATSGHALAFNLAASSSGSYWFVFLNTRNSAVHVQFQSNVRSFSTLTIASAISSAAFETYYYLYTTAFSARSTSNASVRPSSLSASSELPIPLILAITILAILVVLTFRRLRKTPIKRAGLSERSAAAQFHDKTRLSLR